MFGGINLVEDVGDVAGDLQDESDRLYQEAGEGDVDGLLDHSAGSVDESISRQFDDEPGGGVVDVWAGTSGTPLNAATVIAGTDENVGQLFPENISNNFEDLQSDAGKATASISRQFDGVPGGGFVDPDTVIGGAFDNPQVTAIVAIIGVFAGAYLLGQLFDIQVGGTKA